MLHDLTKHPEQTQVLLLLADSPLSARCLLQNSAAAALLGFAAPGVFLQVPSKLDQHRLIHATCAA